jgi:hypothetical protein
MFGQGHHLELRTTSSNVSAWTGAMAAKPTPTNAANEAREVADLARHATAPGPLQAKKTCDGIAGFRHMSLLSAGGLIRP